MPEMPKMSPKMFIAPLGMLTIKFFKIDVAMYLQELRVAFGVVTALNFLCLYFMYTKIQARASARERAPELGLGALSHTRFLALAPRAGQARSGQARRQGEADGWLGEGEDDDGRPVRRRRDHQAGEADVHDGANAARRAAEATARSSDDARAPPRPQICIVSFINYKWGSPMPLLFQCVMQPMALFEQPLFQIHMLGKEAKDDLARPFKAPANPLQEMMGGADAAKPKPKEIKEEKKEAKKTK